MHRKSTNSLKVSITSNPNQEEIEEEIEEETLVSSLPFKDLKLEQPLKLEPLMKKKNKKEKDPNAPAKPKSNWVKFQEWMRPQLAEEGVRLINMFSALGAKWREYKADNKKMTEFLEVIGNDEASN